MRKWFWKRTKRKARGATVECLMVPEGNAWAPGQALDWTGPRKPASTSPIVINFIRLLFEAAHRRNADTVELTLDQAKGHIPIRLGGPADGERIPAGPAYLWSGLLFTCLEMAAIKACEGTIPDPVSGAPWRFTVRKGDNQIRLTRIVKET
jgi:hypothetical protein